MPTVPGWQLGTETADMEIKMIVDLLCSSCRDAHPHFMQFLEMDSPENGKKYKDILNVKVSPFPLPYHRNAF